MKVLMIHGYTQNQAIFRSRTSNLRRKAIKLPGAGPTQFFWAESPLLLPSERCPAQIEPDADPRAWYLPCLLYTSDAADEEDSVDLGGRRIIKKKNNLENS
eukprot:TRINITY_DN38828_c0_g1_i1.p1 TRINITY_DN38828_c0_g1~~TRINITY_DN38828_c0_g1_i1.p1  ORF type:complete len:101 (-),score=19.60 TRINITY_DN38828_c0_g1_i1:103-405(-)